MTLADPELHGHGVGVLVEGKAELGTADHDSRLDGGQRDMAVRVPGSTK